MLYETNSENLIVTKPMENFFVKTIVNSDVIVPDTKPDISNILQVSASPTITDKYIQKSSITVSGFVDFTILYSSYDDSKNINFINYKAPFTQQIEYDDVSEPFYNYIISDVTHIEYEIYNSRKLRLKSIVNFETGIYGTESINILSSLESSVNIPYKEEKIKVLNVCVCQENKFPLSYEINISCDTDEEIEILKTDNKIVAKEHKIMNNKIILKGFLRTNILYSKSNELYNVSNETPFTEILDVENIAPNMHVELKYSLSSFENNYTNIQDGLVVCAEPILNCVVIGFDEKDYNVITDMYCPGYHTETEDCSLKFFNIEKSFHKNQNLTEIIELENKFPNIVKICSFDAKPILESATSYNGSCTIDGYILISFIYLTNNTKDMFYCYSNKIAFSDKIDDASITVSNQLNVEIDIEHCNYIIKNDKALEIRLSYKTNISVIAEHNKKIIKSFSIDNKSVTSPNRVSEITIYFPEDGEVLWDIAKKFSSTIEEIKKINNLEDDIVDSTLRLMIPKSPKISEM